MGDGGWGESSIVEGAERGPPCVCCRHFGVMGAGGGRVGISGWLEGGDGGRGKESSG